MAAGETGGGGAAPAATSSGAGNSIPTAFLGNFSQGEIVPAGPSAGRERIGNFGKFSANSGEFEGQASDSQSRMQPVLDRPDNEGSEQDEFGEESDSSELALFDEPGLDGEVMPTSEADRLRKRWQELKQWEQWQDADELAEPLMTKLVPVMVDGERRLVPVSEASGGYMMQSDYSNKLQQLYNYRDQLEVKEQGLNNLVGALSSGGERFIDMIGFMGPQFFKAFAEAAIIYGSQLDAEQRMSPEQREVVSRERAARARAQQLEMQLRQMQQQMQQMQQPEVSKDQKYYEGLLSRMIPEAVARMKRSGVEWVDGEWSRSIFEKHWNQMLPRIEGKDLTTAHVYDVMMAAHQEVQKFVNAGMVKTPQNRPASALPPVSNMTGNERQLPQGSPGRKPKRERISSLINTVYK